MRSMVEGFLATAVKNPSVSLRLPPPREIAERM